MTSDIPLKTLIQLAVIVRQMVEKMSAADTAMPSPLSLIDEESGLLTALSLRHAQHQEQARIAQNLSCGGALVTLDLDGLASLCRRHGGDAAAFYLKSIARAVQATMNPIDTLARTGFAELTWLVCNTDHEEACDRAQNLAWTLNHLTIIWSGIEIASYVSVAVRPLGTIDTSQRSVHASNNEKEGSFPTELI